MRTKECRDKEAWIAVNCPIGEPARRRIKRATKVRKTFEERGSNDKILSILDGLPTESVCEIGKKENQCVLDKVLPEIQKEIDEGEEPTQKEIKKKFQNAKRDIKPPAPLPKNKYDVILADPPWRYEFSETQSREIENQYPTMELEDIKALKVPAADNSILLLWTTAPKLEEGIAVMNAWGFKYRSCAIWDKERKGMGYWFRIQHELLLVGVKGNFHPPEPENRFDSVIRSPRAEHSRKPDCIYKMIESMFPHGTKIEMFARNNRPGWSSWGNEV